MPQVSNISWKLMSVSFLFLILMFLFMISWMFLRPLMLSSTILKSSVLYLV